MSETSETMTPAEIEEANDPNSWSNLSKRWGEQESIGEQIARLEAESEAKEHEPDLSKLPKVLQQLPWQRWSNDLTFFDGDELLVAVPVCRNDDNEPCLVAEAGGRWAYDLTVVNVNCDEDYFDVNDPDDAWGWTYNDIDYFVNLSQAAALTAPPSRGVVLTDAQRKALDTASGVMEIVMCCEKPKATPSVEKAIGEIDNLLSRARSSQEETVSVRKEVTQRLITLSNDYKKYLNSNNNQLAIAEELAIVAAEAALAANAKEGE